MWTNEEIVSRRTAREILSIIEEICFSDKYKDYRLDHGAYGERDLIIHKIKEKYDIS